MKCTFGSQVKPDINVRNHHQSNLYSEKTGINYEFPSTGPTVFVLCNTFAEKHLMFCQVISWQFEASSQDQPWNTFLGWIIKIIIKFKIQQLKKKIKKFNLLKSQKHFSYLGLVSFTFSYRTLKFILKKIFVNVIIEALWHFVKGLAAKILIFLHSFKFTKWLFPLIMID